MTGGADLVTPADVARSPTVVDEAVSAADGTRVAARWLASSLGGIPSLAILASIIRPPGNGGFDPLLLALGIALAALGAVAGVLLFARVIAPVPLEDSDLRSLDLTRIPGQPYATFDQLDSHLQLLRTSAAEVEYQATLVLAGSKSEEARHHLFELEATRAEEGAAAAPWNMARRRRAAAARARAREQKIAAAAKAAAAAAAAQAATNWTTQLLRWDAIRRDAYRLKAADEVGRRYAFARIGIVFSVALIAGGIILLGLAANPARHPSSAAWLAPCRITYQISGG